MVMILGHHTNMLCLFQFHDKNILSLRWGKIGFMYETEIYFGGILTINKKEKQIMNISELTWDFDFKRILLGSQKYDNNNERIIENILLAKNPDNYVDSESDYKNFYRGHIENYQIVEDVFRKVFKDVNESHKDIMNSFWTTYKFFLQIEYPDVFTPKGSLKTEIPLEKNIKLTVSKVNNGYPPFDSEDYQVIHKKYVSYYKTNFSQFIVEEGYTWNRFLIENFEQFAKVHNCPELIQFAKLTHSIGNINLVPKGFNGSRYCPHLDYWDLSLNSLKKIFTGEKENNVFSDFTVKSIEKYMSAYSSWDIFIDSHYLNNYVDENYNVLPFWKRHFEIIKPTTHEEIIMFLTKANTCIENRGKTILAQIGREY